MKKVRTTSPIPSHLFRLPPSARGRVMQKLKKLAGRKALTFDKGTRGRLDNVRVGRVYLTLEHGLGEVAIIVAPSVYEKYFEEVV